LNDIEGWILRRYLQATEMKGEEWWLLTVWLVLRQYPSKIENSSLHVKIVLHFVPY